MFGVVQEDDPPTVRDAPVAIVFRVNGGVELIVAADRREEQASIGQVVLGDGVHGKARPSGRRGERALARAVR